MIASFLQTFAYTAITYYLVLYFQVRGSLICRVRRAMLMDDL